MSKEKDYIKSMDDNAERRFFVAPVTIEKRVAEGEQKFYEIEGFALKYNQRTNIGWFDEEILPGACDEVINDDIRCLFNHNPNYILARSVDGKGTLALELHPEGLKYRYTTPNRSFALDLQDAIEAGDVSQSSFAFRAKEVIWVRPENENDNELRQIKKMERIYDVSPVTYPAYQDTSVAKRGFDALERNNPTNDNEQSSAKLTVRAAQCLTYNY